MLNQAITRAAVSTMLLFITTGAYASGGPPSYHPYYGGMSLGIIGFSEEQEESVLYDESLVAFYGRLGMQPSKYFSAEARLGLGIAEAADDLYFGEIDIKMRYMLGLYARVHFPTDIFYLVPYAMVGVTQARLEGSVTRTGMEESPLNIDHAERDLSYGVGISVDLPEYMVLSVEYAVFFDKDDSAHGNPIKLHGFSIGIVNRP